MLLTEKNNMAKSIDYYNLLGISIFASSEEIKAAYIKKMKEYHPDTYHGNKREAENITASINAGYEILSDPKQKYVYDQKYGFEEQRQAVLKEQEKQKRKQQKKQKKTKPTYATEKKQQQETKRQQEFSEKTKKESGKIKTNIFSKKPKKDAKVVHPFATTPEQKQIRKERLVLDITIIVLLVIVILLIIFK